ncbi:MAG: hypothetical protein ABI566_13220 [Pseudolysinimonas sp.]
MSTPDSVSSSFAVPLVPRLTVVPRPLSQREVLRTTLERLAPSVLLGAGMVIILTVGTFSAKLVAVNLSTLMYVDTTESARLLGSLSFMSIATIALAIAVLHRSLAGLPLTDRLSRQVGVVALAVAYLHLLLWLSRFIAAAMTSVSSGTLSAFMPNVFWWG